MACWPPVSNNAQCHDRADAMQSPQRAEAKAAHSGALGKWFAGQMVRWGGRRAAWMGVVCTSRSCCHERNSSSSKGPLETEAIGYTCREGEGEGEGEGENEGEGEGLGLGWGWGASPSGHLARFAKLEQQALAAQRETERRTINIALSRGIHDGPVFGAPAVHHVRRGPSMYGWASYSSTPSTSAAR
jgi:hypothetical protein